MGYDWTGARQRRLTIARYGAAVTLVALVVSVAAQVVRIAL